MGLQTGKKDRRAGDTWWTFGTYQVAPGIWLLDSGMLYLESRGMEIIYS